jgi:hypothetical protein
MTHVRNRQSHSETADSRHREPGEKVRTEFGELRTVWDQRGCQVFVVEEPDCARYHADKLFPTASA